MIGADPAVVATVGLDHHPFERLVHWVDGWARSHPDVACFIQYGTVAPPTGAGGCPALAVDELHRLLAGAAVIIGHGGPGTIHAAAVHGVMPIIVPRRRVWREVVDDHQVAFARLMQASGRAVLVETRGQLDAAIAAALAQPPRPRTAPDDGPRAAVTRVGDLIDGLLAR